MPLIRKTFFIFLFGLFAGLLGCEEDPELHRFFGDPCRIDVFDRMTFGSEALEKTKGECQTGITVEGENGEILCEGFIGPTEEHCDGLDNNCNGFVDDPGSLVNPPWASDNPCQQCGKCFQTWEVCRNGEWFCDYKNGAPFPDNNCNGVDDDCDCRTDEEFSTDLVLCYDHEEPETVLCGTCGVGYLACDDGNVKCVGARYPTIELCDGEDNDCNCIVDDTGVEESSADILFEIDTSASMASVINSVTEGICQFALLEESSPYRFALVLVATPDGDHSLALNFDTADKLCETLRGLPLSGGSEPTLSANRDVVDYSVNPLLLNWRDDSRKVLVGFGDEPAWASNCGVSFNQPCLDEITSEIINLCTANEILVYWFENHPEYYQDIAHACGGEFFFLHDDQSYIMEKMNEMFEELCIDG